MNLRLNPIQPVQRYPLDLFGVQRYNGIMKLASEIRINSGISTLSCSYNGLFEQALEGKPNEPKIRTDSLAKIENDHR